VGVEKKKSPIACGRKEKKEKKTPAPNTALPPTRRQKPTHQKPNGGGYAAAQTFSETKKKIRSSIKQKKIN
jgi:hypothetical protein